MPAFSRDAKADALGRCPLFGELSRRELRELAALADEVEVSAGKVLAREGGLGSEFFVIAEGRAQVERDGHTVATLGPGDFFGEVALVDPGPRLATVTAAEPLRAFVLTTRGFWELLDRNHKIAQKILRTLAKRLRALVEDPRL
jgi:CRP/FNR family cyclic AMP-dependent transcriptional regulator